MYPFKKIKKKLGEGNGNGNKIIYPRKQGHFILYDSLPFTIWKSNRHTLGSTLLSGIDKIQLLEIQFTSFDFLLNLEIIMITSHMGILLFYTYATTREKGNQSPRHLQAVTSSNGHLFECFQYG